MATILTHGLQAPAGATAFPAAAISPGAGLASLGGFRMATVQIEYFGMDGVGRNVTEAKRDAGAKIERFISADGRPVFIHYRGSAVMVYLTRYGWEYSIAQLADGAEPFGRGCCICATWERADAVLEAKEHLAQNIVGDTLTDAVTVAHDLGLPFESARELVELTGWHIAFRQCRAQGMTDHEAHSAAHRDEAACRAALAEYAA